jgi:hypothetical protein
VIDCEREKNIRVSEDVVVEVVARGGMEIVFIECPSVKGNPEAHFPLLVALAMQWQETEVGSENRAGNSSGGAW